jgi:hypothetical protein
MQGAELVEVINLTNFKGLNEFMEETNFFERRFLIQAVKEYNREKANQLK